MLRYVTSALTACALASAVHLFAQEPAPAAPPGSQPSPKETVTGCVVEARTTDGDTAYVLNNAEGGSAKMYVLLAGSSQPEWATNVNKKVEVTGPVQQQNAAPAGDDAAGKPNVLRPAMLQVESVKVIADSCK
jgi:hypothetical protein